MEQAGLELIAAGAPAFNRDLDTAGRAVDGFVKSAEQGAGGLKDFAAGIGGIATGLGALAAGGIAAVGAGLFDVSEKAATVRTTIQGINDADLSGILEDAALLESRFGIATEESSAAARTLMEEFGIGYQEAMNLIIAGNEQGLNASGDLLDTIGEYSNLFAENGATAEEFFSLLQTGFSGGALGTDKAADAFKEFGIRVTDGSKTTAAALSQLGIGDLTKQLSDGTITAADAFTIVQDKLREVEDPLAQAQLGVALFGTQFEDLGASAVLGIDMAKYATEDIAATADAGRERFASLGEIFPRLWGEFSTQLLPANDALLDFVNTIYGAEDPLAELWTQVQNLGAAFGAWAAEALPQLQAGLVAAAERVMAWGQETAPGFLASLGEMAASLGAWVIDAAPGVIANLMELRNQLVQWVLDSLPEWANNLDQLRTAAIEWVVKALPELGTNLGKVAAVLVEKTGEFLAVTGPKLLELAEMFVSWVFTTALPRLPGELAKIGGALVTGIGNFLAEVGPPLLDLALQFLDWVGTEVLPALPGKVAEIGSTIAQGILDFIGNVATEAAKVGQAIIDGIAGAISAGASAIADAAMGAARAALDAAKDFLGIASPSRVFADEVGEPITQGIAEGILAAAAAATAAAADIGDKVLKEFATMADQARAILDDVLSGQISLTRGRSEGFGAMLGLRQDARAAAEQAGKAEQAVAAAEAQRQKQQEQHQQTLTDLAAERADLEVTAAQNLDPEKRAAAAKRIAEIEREQAEVRAAMMADELAAQEHIAELRREQAEAARIAGVAERVAADAQAELLAAQAEAQELAAVDPQEAARFLDLRQRQIEELSRLLTTRGEATNQGDRNFLDAQIDLIRQAQEDERRQFQLESERRLTNIIGLGAQASVSPLAPVIAGASGGVSSTTNNVSISGVNMTEAQLIALINRILGARSDRADRLARQRGGF